MKNPLVVAKVNASQSLGMPPPKDELSVMISWTWQRIFIMLRGYTMAAARRICHRIFRVKKKE